MLNPFWFSSLAVRRASLLFFVLAIMPAAHLRIALAAPEDRGDQKGRPPNIVFILADDIGYGDLGCYGGKLAKTPHCDRLAREGVRFTDAHATASTCTPTRYAFITGQYAWRHPPGAGILSGEAPLAIDPARPTVASLLKQGGYSTAVVGKWHLGLGRNNLDFNQEIKPGPLELGFDYAFIMPATGDRVPCVYIENRRVVGLDPADPIHVSYARKVGDDPTGKERPDLLKMKPSAGHDGTIVNGVSRIGFMSGGAKARWNDEEMADVFARKAVSFIERSQDKPFFLYLATHDIHVPRLPSARYRGKSGGGLRGDALEEFDGTVGAVLEALDRLKLADNTLVIVSSDNGGVIDDGYQEDSVAAGSDHRCNGPLRGFKGSLFEGGNREPFLARWPGKIKPGSTSDELIGLVDLLATFAAAAGVKLPADAGPDSFNVLPALLGGKTPRSHLVVQANGVERQALRLGSWKYIPGKPGGPKKTPAGGGYSTPPHAQLYQLAVDLGEDNNLASDQPDRAKECQALLDKIKANPKSRPD